MAKKMREKQAWLWLAKQWDRPASCEFGPCVNIDGPDENTGLCPCPDLMAFAGLIDWDTAQDMKEALAASLPKKSLPICDHRWTLTKAGAKARAAFCRRMAKLCEKGQ